MAQEACGLGDVSAGSLGGFDKHFYYNGGAEENRTSNNVVVTVLISLAHVERRQSHSNSRGNHAFINILAIQQTFLCQILLPI